MKKERLKELLLSVYYIFAQKHTLDQIVGYEYVINEINKSLTLPLLFFYIQIIIYQSAHAQQTKPDRPLVKPACEPAALKLLFWVLSCVPGFEGDP